MTTIRLSTFGGLNRADAPRRLKPYEAQVAHNCLLWDGALRPLAKWVNMNINTDSQQSIDVADDGQTYLLSAMKKAVLLDPMTHPIHTRIGLAKTQFQGGQSNIGYQNKDYPTPAEVGILPPEISLASSVVYTSQYQSKKPRNRLYGATSVRKTGNYIEESSISLIPNQDATGIRYEGDLAEINLVIIGGGIFERTSHRLYVSVSEFDTGHAAANDFKTEWHLVAELSHPNDVPGQSRSYQYNDIGDPTTLPFDLLYSTRFYPPKAITWDYLALTEGGWLVGAQQTGQLAVSERSLYHAWPTENYRDLQYTITGLVARFDRVYIGTNDTPFIMPVSSTEDNPAQGRPVPYKIRYECLPNSMAESTTGAIYAAHDGVVILDSEKGKLVTGEIASSLYPLYKKQYADTSTTPAGVGTLELKFSDTVYGVSFKNQYFGFCSVPQNGGTVAHMGYLLTSNDEIAADRPLQRLVTFDAPNGTPLDHCLSISGLSLLTDRAMPDGGDSSLLYNAVWMLPFPDSKQAVDYHQAAKQCYTWRSKVFAFDEFITMTVARVVFETGFVRLNLYVDGCCTYTVKVCDCLPFTLPMNLVGHTFEIELEGTAIVHEVFLGTSMEDLARGSVIQG